MIDPQESQRILQSIVAKLDGPEGWGPEGAISNVVNFAKGHNLDAQDTATLMRVLSGEGFAK